ncbi:hypothetical protein C8Q70DRAFT_1053340 [Cubamyces menziesii]|uniref:DUF6534 domain-containing protein n=1 Tax=Trametes cubensis TaxID=1111947 RepID=A0AAD7TTE3_9APHY|nr:hypothetical protein C8Q70DRAFT_1053340 [Cubamyces menziesii]KAJ8481463.1 hypothetical protein ONZ51_g5985 [Trametes cubensis]
MDQQFKPSPPPGEELSLPMQLDTTLGATFLGFACTCILYGITSLQTWMYFNYNFKDDRTLRGSVFFLWILDTLHMLFLTLTMYRYVVTDFGNIPAIVKPTWSLVAMIVVVLISNLVVRAIFGMRILRLSGGRWIIPACVVNILSVFVLGDGTYFAVEGLRVDNMVQVHHYSWSFYAGFGAEVAADAIITISQCLLLVQMRTGLERTDSIISLMMKYSINTGLLTSICAILVLVTYSAQPTNFIYFAFYFVYSKLYVNSLLATLNARRSRMMQCALERSQAPASSVMNIEFKAGELVATNQTQVLTTFIELGTRSVGSTVTYDEY